MGWEGPLDPKYTSTFMGCTATFALQVPEETPALRPATKGLDDVVDFDINFEFRIFRTHLGVPHPGFLENLIHFVVRARAAHLKGPQK